MKNYTMTYFFCEFYREVYAIFRYSSLVKLFTRIKRQ